MAYVTLAEEEYYFFIFISFFFFSFSIIENITAKLYCQQGGNELLSPAGKGT